MDLKEKLKNVGLPVAEDYFIKPPKPPYIVFIQDKNIRGISKENLIIESDITIELYETVPDKNLALKVKHFIIENILNSNNDNEIEIYQNNSYIENEQMHMVSFDFNLIEKGGETLWEREQKKQSH